MPQYEYRVVPAPLRGEKARGVKTTPDRFALALSNLMNALGRDGWEYQRADTLPCEERVGLTGTRTNYQHMLVFRRELPGAALVFRRDTSASTAEAPPAQLTAEPPEPAAILPRLGAATDVLPGAAPSVGPALILSGEMRPAPKPGVAAE